MPSTTAVRSEPSRSSMKAIERRSLPRSALPSPAPVSFGCWTSSCGSMAPGTGARRQRPRARRRGLRRVVCGPADWPWLHSARQARSERLERFNRTFREKVLDAYLFGSIEDVRAIIISPPAQASLKIRLYCSSSALRYSSIRGLIRDPISIVFFSSSTICPVSLSTSR